MHITMPWDERPLVTLMYNFKKSATHTIESNYRTLQVHSGRLTITSRSYLNIQSVDTYHEKNKKSTIFYAYPAITR